jgi:hypothetical protein
MADRVVEPAALRKAAAELIEARGAITFLENAKAVLDEIAGLSGVALTVLGSSTVDSHNAVARVHRDNIAGGIEHLRKVSENLKLTADNWEKSDQPWVVRD